MFDGGAGGVEGERSALPNRDGVGGASVSVGIAMGMLVLASPRYPQAKTAFDA